VESVSIGWICTEQRVRDAMQTGMRSCCYVRSRHANYIGEPDTGNLTLAQGLCHTCPGGPAKTIKPKPRGAERVCLCVRLLGAPVPVAVATRGQISETWQVQSDGK